MEEEIWKDCFEFPDRYQVSNKGNVRSKAYLKTGRTKNSSEFKYLTKSRLLSLFINPDGYFQVRLQVNNVKVTRKVHRLVAEAFIPLKEGKNCVNHLNSQRQDNRVENLEWCTNQENIQHGYDSGSNSNAGDLHPRAVLNSAVVLQIKLLEKTGISCAEISRVVGFKYHTVNKVIKRKNWKEIEPD